MFRQRLLLLLAALPVLGVQPLLAQVQVGTCKPDLQSFPTISAAVSTVPAFTIIDVCPGTYPEQVTITKPLTLQGVTVGTANQALITVPPAGLLPNTISMFGESVAAQVLVEGAGQVNITNIAVDGTGGDMLCNGNIWIAAIFYGSGSTGIVNRVRASGQVDGTCGVGIWAENSNSTNEWVTIRNSSVYNVDSAGIFVGSGPTPTLTVDVDNDVVTASAALAAIDADSVNGEVEANSVSNATFGVFDLSPTVTVASNAIVGTNNGLYLGSGGRAVGNHVAGSRIDGVLLGASGATLTNNRIVSSATAGVELGCFAASVNGNIINDVAVGFDAASGSIPSNNILYNTATTITNGCAVAAAALRTSLRAARSANSQQQWHTPATPFGTRTK